MSVFQAGFKPGVGPVLKIMADDDADPFTTPNTDFRKFLFNSENALGYIRHVFSMHFPSTTYGFEGGSNNPGTFHYHPNAGNWTHAAQAWWQNNPGAFAFQPVWKATQILPDLNGFHYVFQDAAERARSLWRKRYQAYHADDGYEVSSRTNLEIVPKVEAGVWGLNNTTHAKFPDGYALLSPGENYEHWGWAQAERRGFQERPPWQWADTTFHVHTLELPIDNRPYPPAGPPTPNLDAIYIGPDRAHMALPGYDLATATAKQKIFDSNRIPMKVAAAGTFTVAAGNTHTITLDQPYSPSIFIDYIAAPVGADVVSVPPWPLSFDGTQAILLRYQIVGSDLIFTNNGDVALDVTFFMAAHDTLLPSFGDAPVLETSDGHITLCRPNTDGSRFSDIILSSRYPTIPIVAQGYVPLSQMMMPELSTRGARMVRVPFNHQGLRPFPIGALERRHVQNPDLHVFFPMRAKKSRRADSFADSSFWARIKTDSVDYYCGHGPYGVEDIYFSGGQPVVVQSPWETVGLRYYVLGIPITD